MDQIYAIVFNEIGEILIARAKHEDSWQIPGGKPEQNETHIEVLVRELQEEADITIRDALPLGAQKVEVKEGDVRRLSSYQLRYIAILDKMLPQSVDPASGTVWERKFVPAREIKSYVKWGAVGDAMFDDAIELYKGWTKEKWD